MRKPILCDEMGSGARGRSDTISYSQPPPELLSCDLCILAYQLYHQSAIWPLDPWYEILARGATDRRTKFMERVHGYATTLPDRSSDAIYGGPASIRALGSSNIALDPIITNYLQLRPRDPAWNGDGAVFLAVRAPSYVVDKIKKVRVASYDGSWKATLPHGTSTISDVHEYDDGTDELIAFEGGTGSFRGTEAAWSLMGYVLKRTLPTGAWIAHVVFRGSRSGNPIRALLECGDGLFNKPEGNADWVSDLATKPKESDYVGGSAAEGFVAALQRCMGSLMTALVELDRCHGAPLRIEVTGHSLGAALATLCCSAMTEGRPSTFLRRRLPSWPWDEISGYFFALPPTAPRDFTRAFLERFAGRTTAPYVAGDPVVECSESVSLGQTSFTGLAGWAGGSGNHTAGELMRLPRPSGAHTKESSHELYLIRHALVTKLQQSGASLTTAMRTATPWATFACFEDLVEGRSISFAPGDPPSLVTAENLRATLVNARFAHHFTAFLEILRRVVADPKSYRGAHLDATYRLAGERVALALEMCSHIDSNDRTVIADTVATQVAALCAFEVKKKLGLEGKKIVHEEGGGVALEADELLGLGFNTRIGLGLILRALEEKPSTTLADYRAVRELDLCLEVQLGDLESWAKKAAAEARG